MKAIVVFALALVSLANGLAEVRSESNQGLEPSRRDPYVHLFRTKRSEVCTPGSFKMDNCNNCFCSDDGSGWNCTLMFCLPETIGEDAEDSPRAKRDQICEPGTVREWKCNTCRCTPDGTDEDCTRAICPEDL